MDGSGSILTAMVGLAGAAVGGFGSFMTSWLTVRAQISQKVRSEARSRRETIYSEFIKEATRLFGDALGHEREDISDLVTLYSLVATMRLVAHNEVIERAERVLDAIVKAYLGPNHTLHELRQFASEGGMDPLRQFSEACRAELQRFGDA
ncbi:MULTISPECIES: hypothetical protein [unclassified Novosphingobium]|uniref:hypothetical protein n=1 Tax=unclassified Novosphingobium TaxID=2644732 RepID=UPI00184C77E4|nr:MULTISPECIES: hypothetical protein [unclassified Novosphingobium]NMN06831.1 hypothetical protein [Novosphingobium sp. SG919]NMN88719.1 hypothetical protein [Novosphingobium sp. SG916]